MATGIAGRERHGTIMRVANSAEHALQPLPPPEANIELQYPGRLSCEKCREPVPARMVRMDLDHRTVCSNIAGNGLILADNLSGLQPLRESGRQVNLFYLDPPYNTGLDFQSRTLEHSYSDGRTTAEYVEFMRRRLYLMHELLADDGSIYVHIGHQMLGHMKIVLDEVFGARNCRNIITRRKCSSKNFTKHQFLNLNDFILFYTKTNSYKWNRPGEVPDQAWVEREYPKTDAKGRYKLVPIHAPGTRFGETGKSWRGRTPPPGKHWQYVPAKLDQLDAAGEIHWSRTGNPRRKVYLDDTKRIPYTDYWADFRDAHHQSVAVTGYPTEKNLDMLKMIVAASSGPGDLVVDPFCGSGTTLEAAQALGREWIGIDESFGAMKASLRRIRHGTEPMGDFVKTPNRADDVSIDLFDAFQQDDIAEKKFQPSISTFRGTPFGFYVEETVLNACSDDVCRLMSS